MGTEPGVIFPQYSPVFSNVVALYVIHEDCTVFEPKPRATAACSRQDAKSHRRLVLSIPRPGTTINHSMESLAQCGARTRRERPVAVSVLSSKNCTQTSYYLSVCST